MWISTMSEQNIFLENKKNNNFTLIGISSAILSYSPTTTTTIKEKFGERIDSWAH